MLRPIPLLAIAGLAVTLWIVPSIGTQGQGTIGQRFSHIDRALASDKGAPALRAADAAVEATLARSQPGATR